MRLGECQLSKIYTIRMTPDHPQVLVDSIDLLTALDKLMELDPSLRQTDWFKHLQESSRKTITDVQAE